MTDATEQPAAETAEWDGGTQVMPTAAETDVVELAWSADTDPLDIEPGAWRPLPRPLIFLLAAVAVGALAVAAFIAGQHHVPRGTSAPTATVEQHPEPPRVPPAPRSVAPSTPPPAAPSSPTLSPLPAAAPTITAPPPTPHSAESDTAGDQRMLASVRAVGGQIYNVDLLLANAHETCRLFRQGLSVDEVNQQMAARTGAPMADVVQITSSAMLSYPNCG